MNKLLKKIVGAAVGLTMAIGVGVAIGNNNRETTRVEATSSNWTRATSIVSGNQYLIVDSDNAYYFDASVATIDSTSNKVALSTAISEDTISGIDDSKAWTFTASNTNWFISRTVNTTTTYIGRTANSNGISTNSSGIANSVSFNGAVVDITGTGDYTGRHLSYNSSSGRFRYFGSGTVYLFEKVDPSKTATTTTVSAPENKTSLDITANPVDKITLSATVSYTSGTVSNPSIKWTSGTPAVATIDQNTGEVTPLARGRTEITATYTGDSTYSGSNGKITITVYDPNIIDFVFADLAAERNWVDSTYYRNITVSDVTLTSVDSGTNGRYHTSDKTWRMYSGGSLTIAASSNKVVTAVESNPSYTFVVEDEKATASFTGSTSFKSITVTIADAPTHYSVTYNSDGGNSIDAQQVARGDAIGTLPTPTKTGFYFLGWKLYKNEAVTGDYFTSSYIPKSNITLKAIWTSDELHVTYNGNGSTGGDLPTDNTTYHYNTQANVLEIGTLVKSHYVFTGWNTLENGTGESYAPGSKITLTADVTLHAQWAPASVSALRIASGLDAVKKVYYGGETFDSTGLVIYATYGSEDEDQTDVRSQVTWTPSPLTVGTTQVTGTFGDQTVTVSGLSVTPAPGTQANPYTVAQARTAANSLGNSTTTATSESYVRGFVSALADETYNSSYGNKTFWITATGEDDADSELEIYRAYYTNSTTKMTQDQFNSIGIGDEVVICGKLKKYVNGNEVTLEMDQKCYLYSHTQETRALSFSAASETLTLNSEFSYSGTVSTAYTIRSNSDVTSSVTYSGYDMSSVGSQTVTVTYHDSLWDMDITGTYTLNIEYATVTTVAINGPSSIQMAQNDSHKFSASLNANTNPSSVIAWSVTDGVGTIAHDGEAEIDSTGELTVSTEATGTLLVTASCGLITSDPVMVTVTGNPVATLDASNLYGFVDGQGELESNIVGGTAPYAYKWSVPENNGVAVINNEYGDTESDVIIDYIGRGDVVVTLTVTDAASKQGTITANVHVTGKLNVIDSTVTTSGTLDIMSDASWGSAGTSGTGGQTNFTNGDFSFSTAKGYKASNTEIRVYSGGTFTITSSNGKIIKNITIAGASGYTANLPTSKTAVNASTYSLKVDAQARLNSITIEWEKTVPGGPINNTNYNAQKAVIEFAEDLTTKLNAVCDQVNGNTTLDGENGLNAKWTAIQGVYSTKRNSLSDSDKDVFDTLIVNASKNEAGDALQKALSSYDYVYAKYHASLTSGDFLHSTSGRSAVQYSAYVTPFASIAAGSHSEVIIVVVSLAILTSIGGFLLIKRRKEQ